MAVAEIIIGAILIAGTLAWSSWSGHLRTRIERRGGDLARFDARTGSTAGKLIPGLLLVLGVTLVVGGVSGN